jgi:predicted NBD/HSP70 family sugar kinase
MTLGVAGRSREVLQELRTHGGSATRTEIAQDLGFARATIAESIDELITAGLVTASEVAPSSGGRRAQLIRLNPQAVHVGIIDIGGSRTRVGVADFTGELIADRLLLAPVDRGPEHILGWAKTQLHDLFDTLPPSVRIIVVGLPGPVDFSTGNVVSPPIMVGWEGFETKQALEREFGVQVIVDNDVNLIALAEHRLSYPDSDVLLIVKLGTGIGGGLVVHGQVLRGARGAAGDIGHTQAVPPSDAPCRCGHVGCAEAVSGGWALVQSLQLAGYDVQTVSDVAQLARDGDAIALQHVRDSAQVVGYAVANAVSLLNPDAVIVAGELLGAGEQIIAIIRETIYQQSLPLATHDLTLMPSRLGPLVGLRGGAQLGIETLLNDSSDQQEDEFIHD